MHTLSAEVVVENVGGTPVPEREGGGRGNQDREWAFDSRGRPLGLPPREGDGTAGGVGTCPLRLAPPERLAMTRASPLRTRRHFSSKVPPPRRPQALPWQAGGRRRRPRLKRSEGGIPRGSPSRHLMFGGWKLETVELTLILAR